ncbi:hypothetical protein POM88_013966 [Heracleum sosnowskyi]|uniref:Uncharacterized protein n=1 Tax=Heracleum sosnowskyi TaxID=360622 RepID=A0AAD8IZJ4_9APIA|nr:hypothetical protein POM88_013966 [Heracleum sosnowskyi]
MAVGASGSRSAKSRVTENRGGDRRVRNRVGGRGRGGRREDVGRGNVEDQNEEDNEDGGDEGEEEGNDEEQVVADALRFGRAPRNICDGDYKMKPKLGEPKLGVVIFINKKIDYWEAEMFSKMSENGRENVKKSEINHISGAKPFDQRYEELEKKNKKPLTILEKFDVSYKKNGQVEEIGKKLKVVVELTMQERNSQEDNSQEGCSQNETPSPGSQRKREVELLLEVMTEVTNMVEAIEEIEVTRARLDEEVQKLATRAYPNGENPTSKILWQE